MPTTRTSSDAGACRKITASVLRSLARPIFAAFNDPMNDSPIRILAGSASKELGARIAMGYGEPLC